MTVQIVSFPRRRGGRDRQASLLEELDGLLQALTPAEMHMVRELFGMILQQLSEAERCA